MVLLSWNFQFSRQAESTTIFTFMNGLTEADNSRPKGYFSGLFPWGGGGGGGI